MRHLYRLALALLLALPTLAHADGVATCYMGDYQRTYSVIGEPELTGGALSMQIDSGLWVTETSPCLVELDQPVPMPAGIRSPSASVVYCYDPHTGDEILRHATAGLAEAVDGALVWTRHGDGLRYGATLPCREIRGEP